MDLAMDELRNKILAYMHELNEEIQAGVQKHRESICATNPHSTRNPGVETAALTWVMNMKHHQRLKVLMGMAEGYDVAMEEARHRALAREAVR
jgi:hypothetical protein